ncbi:MAG TPA: cytochrome c [Trueperaceae bacterium]|nr:cytochrome c [Trueperaceae bacterium]
MTRRRSQARSHAISRWAAPLLGLSVLAALAVAAAGGYGGYGGPDRLAAQAEEAAGVSTGAYTEEQAERGAQVFARSCAGCHGSTLQGGMGPRLAPLNSAWQGMSLGALYRFVSTNMPYSAPGSLEPQQYADVLAHVLASNGYPAGDAELAPDAEALGAFVIDAPPNQ